MLDKKELLIMSHFRDNARKNLTKISKETGIPVSTIFDKLKKYDKNLIIKHTCLLDFSKLGFDIRVTMIIKAPKDKKEELPGFFMKQNEVNTVYRISNGYDYLIECIFRSMKDLHVFSEKLEIMKIRTREEFYVLDDIKREGFLSNPALIKQFGENALI